MGNQLIIHEASEWVKRRQSLLQLTYVRVESASKLLANLAALFPGADWHKRTRATENLHSTQFLIMPQQGCTISRTQLHRKILWNKVVFILGHHIYRAVS